MITVPPKLFFKRRCRQKQQAIVDLIRDSSTGLTRRELAAALNSPIGCVSVMMHQINKELVEQGWKISSTDLQRQQGQRGAPGRRYRLVRLTPFMSGQLQQPGQLGDVSRDPPSLVTRE